MQFNIELTFHVIDFNCFSVKWAHKAHAKIEKLKIIISLLILFFLSCSIYLLKISIIFSLITVFLLLCSIYILPEYHKYIRKKMPDWDSVKIIGNGLINEKKIRIVLNNTFEEYSKEEVVSLYIEDGKYKRFPPINGWFEPSPISNGVSRLRIILKNGEQHEYVYFIEDEFEYLKYKNRLDLLTEHYSIEVKSLYYHL